MLLHHVTYVPICFKLNHIILMFSRKRVNQARGVNVQEYNI